MWSSLFRAGPTLEHSITLLVEKGHVDADGGAAARVTQNLPCLYRKFHGMQSFSQKWARGREIYNNNYY
jgi:hypothetical protein